MSTFGFCGPTYTVRSRRADMERCINLYPEINGPGGRSKATLYGTPGLEEFCTLPTSPVRGMWAGEERLFVVAGNILYEVFSNGSYSARGTVGAGETTPAQIFANGTQLFIVSGSQGYLDNGVSVMAVQPAVSGAYLDGYFIALEPNSNKFALSNLLDGTTWDALDFATRIGGQDRLQAIVADHQYLWLFGNKSTEVWYNSGAANFPFQRVQGSYIEQGAWAKWSLVKLDNSLFFYGGDDRGIGCIWRMNGFIPKRVSNHAVEYWLAQYGETDNAIAYAYQEDGHLFYVISFPNQNVTWAYDVATDMWHERSYWNGTFHEYHLAQHHAYCFDKHFVGGDRSGKVYQQSLSLSNDDGDVIRRQRRAPHISSENKWMLHSSMTLDIDVGETPTGNPEVSMTYSDDGGHSWSSSKVGQLGTSGQFKTRVKFRRLGRSRDRIYDVVIEEPDLFVAIHDAYLELRPGTGA